MHLDQYDRITLLTRVLADGRIEVLAPKVGLWSGQPEESAVLRSGSTVGTLKCRTQRFVLILPAGTEGQVVAMPHTDRIAAVEYGEMLFVLADMAAGPDRQEPAPRGSGGGKAGDRLADGVAAVRAPTDGVFYLRPAPDDPPFVEVGNSIRTGTTLGLVEVMKTFNPILYGAPDLPDKAEVVEVRVVDGQEIHAGEILITVRRRGK